MSNATLTSSSSTSDYHAHHMPFPPSGSSLHYEDDITYTRLFNPSPFELLFLPHLQFAIDGLIRLRAQCASLNAIIEETNVYVANLAFNATATAPNPLRVEGPMTVPSFPVDPNRLEFHLQHQLSGLGPLPENICDANPNDPTFLRAAETYRARIGAALELALNQNQLCPCCTRTEPVLSRQADSTTLDDERKSPSPPCASFKLVYPLMTPSRDSSPIYAQSISVAMASPSPSPSPKPLPKPTPTPTGFNSFNVNDEPLAPLSVPFLASGKFNPAFVSIRDAVRANPNIQIDTKVYTNPPSPYNYLNHVSFSWQTTAPETVQATVARSVDYLCLDIFLGIVVSDKGWLDFLERTIPEAHMLLTTISMGVIMMTISTEMENNKMAVDGEVEDSDDLVPVFVGPLEGEPREVMLLDGRMVTVVRMGSTT
ncbi:hypothetical protein Moror_4127 [Moniliophthora roreri MCA 2997]|uniref:Uncharacterized protein n=1 Tax=Moniliophthora roreri (strain MCA 2997) TaxID=1381753 RepID=V2XDZ6_MONRO|nr:hypothetical protein Moror_4127 [Moniliophthora roreri MCA 2997]